MTNPRKSNRPQTAYREPVRSLRSLGEGDHFKALLRVDVDWNSDGIWEIPSIDHPYAGRLVTYESLNLPPWLIDRFHYWTSWYDSHAPWNSPEAPDSALFSAYALSLAIDLKRHLGHNYYVECAGREIHDDRAYLRGVHGMEE